MWDPLDRGGYLEQPGGRSREDRSIEKTKRQRTCAEQQQHLHAQVLVVGHLQPDKLAGDLQHLLTLVGHVGQLHPGPDGATAQQGN